MDRRCLSLVLLVSACGGKGMPPAYPLEKYATHATSNECAGALVRDSAGGLASIDSVKSATHSCSEGTMGATAPEPSFLRFTSFTDGNLCFEVSGQGSSPDEAVYKKELDDKPVWVSAVDSLDTLKGPVNKPPQGASRTWDVKVTSDVHFNKDTEKIHVDHETTVTIEKDRTDYTWELAMCTPFVLSPSAKHLVVVVPQGMYGASWAPPERHAMVPDDEFDAYREKFPWTAASVMIWNIQPPAE
jgi:hypothetical protein